MSTPKTFVEFHALRSFPPSNLNRDDLGAPKTAVFGGKRRLRLSSQCLKRTWRTSSEMTGAFAESQLGVRTAHLPGQVLAMVGESLSAEQQEGLRLLLSKLGKKGGKADKVDEADDGDGEETPTVAAVAETTDATTAHLLFLSRQEIEAVSSFARDNADDLGKMKTGRKGATDTKKLEGLRKKLEEHLTQKTTRNAVDVGLFGRFITSDEFDTIDGALHVAHGLGTQKVEVEYDYFTAVDDLGEGSGAGHLGESEFASSVLYLFASCDLGQLQTNLGERNGNQRVVDGEARTLAARSLASIAKAMALATPTGKRTGTAPYTPAAYLEVVVRRQHPLSLANAFLQPVAPKGEDDVMAVSIERLVAERQRNEAAFGLVPDARFVLSLRPEFSSEGNVKTLADLGEKLEALLGAEPQR
jgi:CRISPR system Cascade subunit CasC